MVLFIFAQLYFVAATASKQEQQQQQEQQRVGAFNPLIVSLQRSESPVLLFHFLSYNLSFYLCLALVSICMLRLSKGVTTI